MASLGRRRLGLNRPRADITGFPVRTLRKGRALRRAHHRDFGAWWFASDTGGRFNLDPPNGTCYLAVDEETALRERLGPTTGVVSYGWADETRVSTLQVHRGGRVANTCDQQAALYGMTREIATYTGRRYRLTRMWANKFHEHGLRGVLYESRFTTVARANSFALFDTEGAKSWPEDPDPATGVDACRRAGLTVETPPTIGTLRILY